MGEVDLRGSEATDVYGRVRRLSDRRYHTRPQALDQADPACPGPSTVAGRRGGAARRPPSAYSPPAEGEQCRQQRERSSENQENGQRRRQSDSIEKPYPDHEEAEHGDDDGNAGE